LQRLRSIQIWDKQGQGSGFTFLGWSQVRSCLWILTVYWGHVTWAVAFCHVIGLLCCGYYRL
jgi:hypothetical protein